MSRLAIPRYYRCGICDHFHAITFTGDCRQDDARFTEDQLNAKHADWIEVAMPGSDDEEETP